MKSETHPSATSSSKPSALSILRRKLSPRRRNVKEPLSSSFGSSSKTVSVNNSSKSELQRVFNYFDENEDGKISAEELHKCVRTAGGELSMEEAAAAVKSWDMDGDGMLGFEEFERVMEGSEEDKNEELKQAFGMYETDPGSGFITPSSLKRMLTRLGDFSTLENCKAMIRTFDLNGDGVLSFPEFALMMA